MGLLDPIRKLIASPAQTVPDDQGKMPTSKVHPKVAAGGLTGILLTAGPAILSWQGIKISREDVDAVLVGLGAMMTIAQTVAAYMKRVKA